MLSLLNHSSSLFEKKCFLGKAKVPVRFVAVKLTQKDLEKRMRKINRAFCKKGKTPSPELLQFSKWSIYITNVSEEKLSYKDVHLLYTIRWQIELFFKLCKSVVNIDKFNGRSINRIICEIYAKLICVVKFFYIYSFSRSQENEISFDKAYKLLKIKSREFFKALTSIYLIIKFFDSFLMDVKKFCNKDRHRKRQTTHQKLILSASGVK